MNRTWRRDRSLSPRYWPTVTGSRSAITSASQARQRSSSAGSSHRRTTPGRSRTAARTPCPAARAAAPCENQIVNALAWGSVVYARRIAGTHLRGRAGEPGVVDRPAVALGVVLELALALLGERGRDRVEDHQRPVEGRVAAERRQRPVAPRRRRRPARAPVTSSTGSGRDRRVGLGERDDLDGVGDDGDACRAARSSPRRSRRGRRPARSEPEVPGLRQRAQVEAGDDAEEAGPGAAGGPEEVGVLVGVGTRPARRRR